MKANKIICMLLAAALLTGTVSGCNKNDTGDTSSATSGDTSSYVTNLTPANLTVDGQTVAVPYVMKLDGHEISLDEYRFYFMNAKSDLDGGDETFWTNSPGKIDDLKKTALDTMKRDYTISRVAADNSIALTEEDMQSVSSKVTAAKQNYGSEEAFLSMLVTSYADEAFYTKMAESNTLYTSVYNKLTAVDGKYAITQDEMRAKLASDYVCAKHILIPFDSDGTTTNKDKAESILGRAQNGEDFNELVSEYSEDTGKDSYPDGYYFTRGQMVKPFETAAYALGENEISELVESDYGYHIIKRLPLDQAYIDKNMATLMQSHRETQLNNEMQTAFDTLKVEYGDQYDKINVSSLK